MKNYKERLNRYLQDLEKSILNLDDSLKIENPNDMIEDAIIKRFELAYELAWKTLKAYPGHEGIICTSTGDCFKQAKATGIISDEPAWLSMIETRNVLVHTYSAEKSREMIRKIREDHAPVLRNLLEFFT